MTTIVRFGDEHPITFATNIDVQNAITVQVLARLEGVGTPIVLASSVTANRQITHVLDGTLPVGRYRVSVKATWLDAGPVTFPTVDSEYLEVLPAALAIPFATPQQLSDWTEGAIAATDSRAPLILAGATAAIQAFCGWHIAPAQDFTLTLDGDGGKTLALPSLKVNSIALLQVVDSSGTVYNLTDYVQWSRRTGNIRLIDGWVFPDVWGGITVTFNSGFATVPVALTQLTLQVSAIALSSPTGATREQAGQVSMMWATTAPGVAGGLSLLERDYLALSPFVLPKEV